VTIGDLELELERILLEKSDVQETLAKLEAVCSSLEQDKKRLQDEVKKVRLPYLSSSPSSYSSSSLLFLFLSFCTFINFVINVNHSNLLPSIHV
jgi:hypothetical protein